MEKLPDKKAIGAAISQTEQMEIEKFLRKPQKYRKRIFNFHNYNSKTKKFERTPSIFLRQAIVDHIFEKPDLFKDILYGEQKIDDAKRIELIFNKTDYTSSTEEIIQLNDYITRIERTLCESDSFRNSKEIVEGGDENDDIKKQALYEKLFGEILSDKTIEDSIFDNRSSISIHGIQYHKTKHQINIPSLLLHSNVRLYAYFALSFYFEKNLAYSLRLEKVQRLFKKHSVSVGQCPIIDISEYKLSQIAPIIKEILPNKHYEGFYEFPYISELSYLAFPSNEDFKYFCSTKFTKDTGLMFNGSILQRA